MPGYWLKINVSPRTIPRSDKFVNQVIRIELVGPAGVSTSNRISVTSGRSSYACVGGFHKYKPRCCIIINLMACLVRSINDAAEILSWVQRPADEFLAGSIEPTRIRIREIDFLILSVPLPRLPDTHALDHR